ncbi:probably inactive leucine-rich repeat receptor-like protein kinase At3g28040 [Magnolia sinica]|uniref:probably inactive leucine-rich repeat receptor-like protein kinase At3g28040 n=1 Tax=Magnolia sinica TaxID=86752 RepID=UPI002657DDED|nr:probably inactive leucine-rich repeat receptor-like protein kinase At3g28040 [Magnolia sinica]
MRKAFLLCWLLFPWILSNHSCNSSSVSLQLNDDVLGLIVFKSGLQDPTSALTSWNEDDNTPCSWAHVQCDPVNGRVSQISLDGLGLSGKIGRGLEKLQNLQVLSLSHNNFSGNVIPQLSLFPSLKRLNLSHNSLFGRIPVDLGNITSTIRVLDLSENSLSGPIPEQLFNNCLSLRFISLGGNSLEGPVPHTLQKCMSLGSLNLSDNHLSGNPDFTNVIWQLKELRILDLSHNTFSGPIPEGLLAIHNLKEFYLQGNQFSGPLPSDIGLCLHMKRFDSSNNLLMGALPDSLQQINSLEFISLSNNGFIGDFPYWIGNMNSLQSLDFARNGFSGALPSSMGDLKSLNSLILSHNRLVGEIPGTLVYCTQLSKIKLNGNSLNGSIPPGLFDLGLEEVDLSSNEFSGSIPPGSSRLFESLQSLDLSKNKLTGVIPPEVGLYFHLRYLNLSWNNLQSRFPPELGYFRNLSVLDLRSSLLYGSIPEDLCDSNSLSVLQLDGNSLSGPIPAEIGNCSSLYLLTLSHNSLNGPIPMAMSRLQKLKILNLEFNSLSGEIPQQLGSLDNLLAVNISYNRLVGRLPNGGVFPSLDQSALQGNLGLCSPLLKGPCKMNVPKPLVLNPDAYGLRNGGHEIGTSDSMRVRHSKRFLSISAIVAISAAVLIVIGVVVVSLLNVSARRRIAFIDHAMDSMFSSSSRSRGPALGRLVLFHPNNDFRCEDWVDNAEILLNKATEIGKGVFGTVYKASIGGGRIVAIKKLITSNIIQYHDDFDREVRILGNARHPNLMTVQGYYWTPQFQLLISDYASNGSLHARLHERSSSTPPLTWANRFKIALGTAKGLAHLHQSFRPPIIHYNLKPSNILLDKNCNPKISDFGLARLLPKLDKHVLNSRFQTALGYVAPELACQSLRINEKCDIYGFGVMILELVTGRKPVQYGDDDVVVLCDHVKVMLDQGNVLDCVDPSMTEYPEEEVLPVLKLGLVCTSQIPSSRPSMPEVVQILQVIKTPIPERMEAF